MFLEDTFVAQTTHYAMGTVMAHKVYSPFVEDCLEAVCGEITRIEGLLSRFIPGSDISRINEAAGISSVEVSFETYEILSKAIELSQGCPGCFDVTIGPLVNLWSTCKRTFSQPDVSHVQEMLALVNYRDLVLPLCENAVGLANVGQSIDVGGIGKGFAGDKIRQVYDGFGNLSAYSNLGGNVIAIGSKPDGYPWQIGIQHPREENKLLGAVSVADKTVVTSGDYQRYYVDERGNRHHHILDPVSGYPAQSGLISVTIVSQESLLADALSTILFVAGLEKGYEFLKSFSQVEAIFVDCDMRVFITPGLRYDFQADTDISVTILE